MKNITILPYAVERIKSGERLITIDDLDRGMSESSLEEGSTLYLMDQSRNFIGQALAGRQNKGLAWVFTTDRRVKWSPIFIREFVSEALKNREALFSSDDTNAFRLYNGEGDGVGGVTIDWYDGFVQFNWYSRGMHQYREWFLDALLAEDLAVKGVYETKRFALYEGELAIEATYGEEAPASFEVKENGVYYGIDLGDNWMTGIFMDQRDVRDFIRVQADGKSVLNLFSYTGAFSVAGAVGGANHTVSVDVANRSMETTKENFLLNGIKPVQEQHEVRVMDVFDYIQYAKRHDLQFDIVVCDPPSFARTKKYQFQAEKDYEQLARDLFELTKPGGMTILSTNHSGYYKENFQEDLVEASQAVDGKFYLIQLFDLPEDFPTSADRTSQYLKVLVFYRES